MSAYDPTALLARNLGALLPVAIQALGYARVLIFVRTPRPLALLVSAMLPIALMPGEPVERIVRCTPAGIGALLLAQLLGMLAPPLPHQRGASLWAAVVITLGALVTSFTAFVGIAILFPHGLPQSSLFVAIAAAVSTATVSILPPATPLIGVKAKLSTIALAYAAALAIAVLPPANAPHLRGSEVESGQAPNLASPRAIETELPQLIAQAIDISTRITQHARIPYGTPFAEDSAHCAVLTSLATLDAALRDVRAGDDPAQHYLLYELRNFSRCALAYHADSRLDAAAWADFQYSPNDSPEATIQHIRRTAESGRETAGSLNRLHEAEWRMAAIEPHVLGTHAFLTFVQSRTAEDGFPVDKGSSALSYAKLDSAMAAEISLLRSR